MKKIILFSLFCCFISHYSSAQNAKVYAFTNGSLVEVDPFSAETETVGAIDGMSAIAIGSSTFDHYHRRYICSGGGDASLKVVDVETAEVLYDNPISSYPNNFSNELEYDLQYDVLYGMKPFFTLNSYGEPIESETYLTVVNTETAEESLIAKIEGLDAIFTRTSTFNPDDTQYTFIGRDSDQVERIFTLDATTGEVLHNPIITDFGNMELQYDVKQAKYFGIKGQPVSLVEVDIETGDVTPIIATTADALALGSGAYSQAPGLYMFIGMDSNWDKRLYVIDTEAGEVVSDDIMEGNIAELQADNTNFANERYSKTGAVSIEDKQSNAIAIFPNPAIDQITFEMDVPGRTQVKIYNSNGQLIIDQSIDQHTKSLDISALPGGHYMALVTQNENSYKSRFVKL